MNTWLIVMVIIAGIVFVGVTGLIVWMSGPKYAAGRQATVERLEQQGRENMVARREEYEAKKKAARQELAQLRGAKARGVRVPRERLAELDREVRGYDAVEKMHAQRQYSGYRDGTGRLESSLWKGPTRPLGQDTARVNPATEPDEAPLPTPAAPTPPKPAPVAASGLTRPERVRQWATVRAQFREHLTRMASYETDPALAIDFPAFNDVTVSEVSAMVKALRVATHLEDATDRETALGGSDALLAQFRDAVHDFGGAVDTAERAARRLRWSALPSADQDDLKQMRHLLNHAENPGNTDQARATYYAKLQQVARRLNDRHGVHVVPATVVAAIAAKAELQIER